MHDCACQYLSGKYSKGRMFCHSFWSVRFSDMHSHQPCPQAASSLSCPLRTEFYHPLLIQEDDGLSWRILPVCGFGYVWRLAVVPVFMQYGGYRWRLVDLAGRNFEWRLGEFFVDMMVFCCWSIVQLCGISRCHLTAMACVAYAVCVQESGRLWFHNSWKLNFGEDRTFSNKTVAVP